MDHEDSVLEAESLRHFEAVEWLAAGNGGADVSQSLAQVSVVESAVSTPAASPDRSSVCSAAAARSPLRVLAINRRLVAKTTTSPSKPARHHQQHAASPEQYDQPQQPAWGLNMPPELQRDAPSEANTSSTAEAAVRQVEERLRQQQLAFQQTLREEVDIRVTLQTYARSPVPNAQDLILALDL